MAISYLLTTGNVSMEAKTLAARARQIHTNPYINVALILLSQKYMSVLVKQTAVMRMLSVTYTGILQVHL